MQAAFHFISLRLISLSAICQSSIIYLSSVIHHLSTYILSILYHLPIYLFTHLSITHHSILSPWLLEGSPHASHCPTLIVPLLSLELWLSCFTFIYCYKLHNTLLFLRLNSQLCFKKNTDKYLYYLSALLTISLFLCVDLSFFLESFSFYEL